MQLMDILSHCFLFGALVVTIWPTIKRLALFTRWPVFVFVFFILVFFVLCHFRYRTEIGNKLLSNVFSSKTFKKTFLNRIVFVDLDELIGRNLINRNKTSTVDKIARRYFGEDVVLYCVGNVSFNAFTKLTNEDIEVEWFHNNRRLWPAIKYRLIHHKINIESNSGFLSAVIVVSNLTINDFGSYKCDLSMHSKTFLTDYIIRSNPSEVVPVFPKEITRKVPPGSMINVRYTFCHAPQMDDDIDFYVLAYNKSENVKLLQQGKYCSMLTMMQMQLYQLYQHDKVDDTPGECRIAHLPICVSFGYNQKHEFVSERLVQTEWVTHIHPVTLIVKDKDIKDDNQRKTDNLEYVTAVTNAIQIVLIVLLFCLMDIVQVILIFISLFLLLKPFFKRVVPYAGVKFLKQEWRCQKIYIACSPRDRVWTNRNVVEFLESLGHETFLPARDCPPNQLETQALAEGVEACHKYVMVVSRHYLGEEHWKFQRSLIVDNLQQRQCCPDGEHPTCLLFVCLGAAEVPGPRVGGSVLHAAQARRRGDLRRQVRSWLEGTIFCEVEWNMWYLLGVSCLTAISRSYTLLIHLNWGLILENLSVVIERLSYK